MENFEFEQGPVTDEEVRSRLSQFAKMLRSYGLIGDTAANVGDSREAGGQTPKDGMAPMVRSVPQVDR